ncbi:hypothetical protein MRB53_027390 [Persea americana]|uniref:Uncharacterized protein n=1 Tax=Persea americana TaxID=3435 RepID=A0ACC2LKV5_PERAE|nr:hypothetical protein MRB53_027390 [Persea americana]
MTKDGAVIYDVDVEEGEISGDEVEVISEADFIHEPRVSRQKSSGGIGVGGGSRVWMNYPVTRSGNYAPDLYNLAWAQAVQNKPLYARGGFGSAVRSNNDKEGEKKGVGQGKEICSVVIDDSSDEGAEEKEEGELEEGEIDLDSDVVMKSESPSGNESLLKSKEREFPSGNELDELEEGSKEMESENEVSEKEPDKESKEKEFDKRVNMISEALKTVTVSNAEKSFQSTCSQLKIAFESLQLLILESRLPIIEELVEQAFARVRDLHYVLCLGNSQLDEQNKQNKNELSRLFDILKKQDPAIFSPEQMQEVEGMMQSLAMEKEKEGDVVDNASHGLISSKEVSLEPMLAESGVGNNGHNISKLMKLDQPFGPKGRGDFGPLIDLHMDYDEGSLPSPTRENPPILSSPTCENPPILPSPTRENPPILLVTPPMPAKKTRTITGDEVTISHLKHARQEEMEDAALHPYVTDALRAVSSYQQKFGRTSFFNQLPSPTPSEERDDDGDGDSLDEVSSSAVGNARIANSNVVMQPPVSNTAPPDGLNGQGRGKTVGLLGPGSTPIVRPIKTRDPRLRIANLTVGASDQKDGPQPVDNSASKNDLGGIVSSRKHKVVDESVIDGHALKKQRNSSMDSGLSNSARVMSGSGGWLEDGNIPGSQPSRKEQLIESMEVDESKCENGEVDSINRNDTNAHLHGANGGGQPFAVIGNGPVSLPSLLKDIAVNPTMLMYLIKMEQERLAAEGQQKPANIVQPPSCSNELSGSGNVTSSKPTSLLEIEKSHGPSQTTSMNSQSESGKVRMKPRDPRRILHNNIVQRSENSVSDQLKTVGVIPSIAQVGKDNIAARELGKQAVTSLHSQSTPLPDIAPQFTKKLKNIADILSNSQATNTPVTIPPNTVQSMPLNKTEKLDIRVATDSNDQQSGTGLAREEASTTSQLPNPWGDVDHLLEGYDDQQKAAIQRERARRIEEQNKMFAARKLCLVLDLDHTLLNSAKFIEVDKVHDEILRKKEELDREKPQRHLFRFQHMGMWTKLRPGIWNFLEKASKLYELHLYTMGNRYYATEMAKVLDPTGTLFAGRVISRGDDGDPFDSDEKLPKNKDLDGVLGMESAVVIIDDSVRVWPHNKLNLIVVERYTYFPSSRRQFGLLGPSLLEIDHDERPEDGTLASSLGVIERIHQDFFSHRSLNEVDVRNILAAEQRKILSNCRIVFSRVFPVGEANPHLHPLWQTAQQFGAVCTNQIDEQVTHVVANSLGTDKVNWALSTGRHVVHPGWVEASALLYRRANERDFAVKL